jgi:hypothetical protein
LPAQLVGVGTGAAAGAEALAAGDADPLVMDPTCMHVLLDSSLDYRRRSDV